jgi:4'-phosphopantetheinyl transferase EntD
MIDDLLPVTVKATETRELDRETEVFPAEAALIEHAVDKRRREFTAGRTCAHTALEVLGLAATPIASGERGEPVWPGGVVGSITHTAGYCASAVAREDVVRSIGIDAEPAGPLERRVLAAIARPEELSHISARTGQEPGVPFDRLLFSAKESVFKAWFPLERGTLGFKQAIVRFAIEQRWFEAVVLTDRSRPRAAPPVFFGRWDVCDGLVLTTVVTTHDDSRF